MPLTPDYEDQDRFIFSGVDEQGRWLDYVYDLFAGGVGSGKTWAGSVKGVLYANDWPKSWGLVTAPTYNMLHDATLPVYEEVLDAIGMRRGHEYDYVSTREELIFHHNESRIIFRTTEHPQRLRGPNLSWFHMDEPRDSPLVAFTNLQARLRRPGYPHAGWLTTTPVGKNHWLYYVFHTEDAIAEGLVERSASNQRKAAKYHTYHGRTQDNRHIPEEFYYQILDTLGGSDSQLAKQETEGLFVHMTGLTFPMWKDDYYTKPLDQWPTKPENMPKVIAGVDFGFTNAASIIVEGMDYEGRRYIMDEFWKQRCSLDEFCMTAKHLMKRYGIRAFFCDSARPDWIAEMRRPKYALPAVKAEKRRGNSSDLSSGIGACTHALMKRVDGDGQAFYVNPAAKHFRMDIDNYVDDEGADGQLKEHPKKEGHWDAMDAWRYGEKGILRLGYDTPFLARGMVQKLSSTWSQ